MDGPDFLSAAPARPDATLAITRGVARMFLDHGWAPLTEFRLSSGRRVDVAGLDKSGRLLFVEVKSCRADFETDAKWPDYLEFCDQFFFAVDSSFPLDLIPDEVGLIRADAFGGAILRESPETKLTPARRKAVTLRFARHAATRIADIG